ncbi:oxygen-dependent tRNA uridine(34) hydroxylase TrhO [Oceanobacillus alkalisoli]|uniref:oxygen-dependent tRNA uridine(34) hydroxylase TrhO n=1 Tax=Oceanobacillus alkalisoli TaxID=2925113 RepID=UPI001EEFCB58|nr:rhodanese-related sulfurtransferase [Oceanobacillus alkalisoli]MCF3944614.1 rhodanese-related sulfurtransferase [Oceanobacillus alkalisoli]MCG5104800.1 rhodanese-related sulfurtransferase [Oceanobacillus alkalisoli]
MEKEKYQVLLYYNYVHIEDPEAFAAEHLKFCKEAGLKGRILVAEEGINGTVSGTIEQTQQYMDMMHADERFKDIVFKIDEHEGHAFKKMHVRPRKELVTLRLEDDIDPLELTGKYLEPKDFRAAMERDDVVILDARNDYEYDLGHFRGAIRPDIETFRELPDWVRENRDMFEGKKILTYCTGGIRCEKFSGWLVREGFEDVAQLHGGIAVYGKDPEVQGDLWDGKMYVFDERISVPVNQREHVIVGKDYFDGEPCERYVNCANPECNRQMLTSEENEHKYLRGCSHECRVTPRNLYVKEQNLSEEEVAERLQALEEEKQHA